jgi:hypothetical protein
MYNICYIFSTIFSALFMANIWVEICPNSPPQNVCIFLVYFFKIFPSKSKFFFGDSFYQLGHSEKEMGIEVWKNDSIKLQIDLKWTVKSATEFLPFSP